MYSGESGCIWAKLLYSSKCGSILENVVVFGQGGCIWEKVAVIRLSCCIRVDMVVFGKSDCLRETGCVRAKVVNNNNNLLT